MKNTYTGEAAIYDYHSSISHQYLPLVELDKSLNPYHAYGVRIFVKDMSATPLGNVKSLPALSMLQNFGGSLEGKEVVEASSGNTVFSLGLLARHFGVSHVRALVSKEVSAGKLKLLRLAGVTPEIVDEPICPDPGNPRGAIAQARERGSADNAVNLGQYESIYNPRAHELITGPQIFDQLDGKIDYFFAGLGTTGTFTGTSKFLKNKISSIRCIGIARMPNNTVPGVRTKRLLDEVGFDWSSYATDDVVLISTVDAYQKSLDLIRRGLLLGPSSGFALAGVLKFIEDCLAKNRLQDVKNKSFVFIAPDGPLAYLDSYFEILGESSFPSIVNEQLLAAHDSYAEKSGSAHSVLKISPAEVMSLDRATIIDVREPDEFADHSIASSINLPLSKIDDWIKRVPSFHSPIIFVCKSGRRSELASLRAAENGVESMSLDGGMMAWSAKDYPRIKNIACIPRAS